MSELREWLRRNKFEQYADAFEANDIGLDILPELNERDLEQLGVSLGNRRRLLKAIAEGAATIAQPKAAEARAPETSADAERRQVTVLFCDMVGSTALSGAVDPELLGSLIRRYQDAAAGAIGRFGGFVAKFMGDGVLAYFGFPHAFEDAAERAVRAAIGILTEVGNIERPDGTRLQARVGIATGLVVVGEIVGTGTAQERTIVGETPNLAARLQALAAPDTILISETTQNLLGGLFKLEPTRRARPERFRSPDAGLASGRRSGGRDALCSGPQRQQHSARRPRSRNGADARSLAARAWRRRPDRDVDWRGRDRQIALHRGAAGSHRRRTAWLHLFAVFAAS